MRILPAALGGVFISRKKRK